MRKALLVIRAGLVASEWFLKGGRRMMCGWTRLQLPDTNKRVALLCFFFFPFCFVFFFFQMQVWYFLFFNISASSENNNAVVGGAEAASAALESCLSCIWSRTLKDWGTSSNKPNARSRDPKARVPVLHMFSPSACAKQKSLKPRQLQASNEWILAAS